MAKKSFSEIAPAADIKGSDVFVVDKPDEQISRKVRIDLVSDYVKDNYIDPAVNVEKQRAQNAEEVLSANILAESERAMVIESGLQAQADAMKGRGGYLTAYDFGSASPSQNDLTNYALSEIDKSDPALIWNGTHVKNLFDSHVWVLTNTPDTEPPIFEWSDDGYDSVSQATNSALGVMKGVNDPGNGSKDGLGTMRPDGTVETIGFTALKGQVDSFLGSTTPAETGDEAASAGSSAQAARTDHKHKLEAITQNNTVSSVAPSAGASFTAIDTVSRDAVGRVTGVNTKTVTLPAGGGLSSVTHDETLSGLGTADNPLAANNSVGNCSANFASAISQAVDIGTNYFLPYSGKIKVGAIVRDASYRLGVITAIANDTATVLTLSVPGSGQFIQSMGRLSADILFSNIIGGTITNQMLIYETMFSVITGAIAVGTLLYSARGVIGIVTGITASNSTYVTATIMTVGFTTRGICRYTSMSQVFTDNSTTINAAPTIIDGIVHVGALVRDVQGNWGVITAIDGASHTILLLSSATVTHDNSLVGKGVPSDNLAQKVSVLKYTKNSDGDDVFLNPTLGGSVQIYGFSLSGMHLGAHVTDNAGRTAIITAYDDLSYYYTAVTIALPGSGGGISEVAHDGTLSGDGTSSSPLSVAGGGGSSVIHMSRSDWDALANPEDGDYFIYED